MQKRETLYLNRQEAVLNK